MIPVGAVLWIWLAMGVTIAAVLRKDRMSSLANLKDDLIFERELPYVKY
jgi:hypothetical protein